MKFYEIQTKEIPKDFFERFKALEAMGWECEYPYTPTSYVAVPIETGYLYNPDVGVISIAPNNSISMLSHHDEGSLGVVLKDHGLPDFEIHTK